MRAKKKSGANFSNSSSAIPNTPVTPASDIKTRSNTAFDRYFVPQDSDKVKIASLEREVADLNLKLEMQELQQKKNNFKLTKLVKPFTEEWMDEKQRTSEEDEYLDITGHRKETIVKHVDIVITANRSSKVSFMNTNAEYTTTDAVIMFWAWSRMIGSYATMERLTNINRGTLKGWFERICFNLYEHYKSSIHFLDNVEWQSHCDAVYESFQGTEETKNLLKNKLFYIVDGVGFGEEYLGVRGNVDALMRKRQICHFKGNKPQFRVQIVVSPLGKVVFVGDVDDGKQNDNEALYHTLFMTQLEKYYDTVETPSSGSAQDMPIFLMGDQGYILQSEKCPPWLTLVLTRSAHTNGVWKRLKNKSHIVTRPDIAGIRSTVERVFGGIKNACVLLREDKRFSSRSIRWQLLVIHCALSNIKLESNLAAYYRI